MVSRAALCGLIAAPIFSACLADSGVDEAAQGAASAAELSAIERAWSAGSFAGDLSFRASWRGEADLDLYVETPAEETIYYGSTRDSTGGRLTTGACAACPGDSSEEVNWLESAPEGRYEFYLERYDARAVRDVVIEVFRAGALEQTFRVQDLGQGRGARSESFGFTVEPLPTEASFDGFFAVQLLWEGSADLDLSVVNPRGEVIRFDRTSDSAGALFSKERCLLRDCDGASSEEIVWERSAHEGSYDIAVTRYGAGSVSEARVVIISRGRVVREVGVSIPARRGASAEVAPFVLKASSFDPDAVAIVSHRDEEWVRGDRVRFDIATSPAVELVEFSVNGRAIGERSSTQGGTHFEHTFAKRGQQRVEAIGFDGGGAIVGRQSYTIVVTDEQGSLPRRGSGARDVTRALLAKRLLALDGVKLRDYHPSRKRDGAYPILNVRDAISGPSQRSSYRTAPGGKVYLDETMLQFMVMLHDRFGYSYTVSSIAGAEHSRNSLHYRGTALDVVSLNGVRIGTWTRPMNRRYVQICRDYGAVEIFQPPDAGHRGHIHCAWPHP